MFTCCCCDQKCNMSCFEISVKKQTLWILTFCCLVSLLYISRQMNTLRFAKPYSLLEFMANAKYVVNLDKITNSGDKRENSNYKMNKSSSTAISQKNASNVQAVNRNPSTVNLNIRKVNARDGLSNKSEIKVGILIPSSTRKIKKPLLDNLSISTKCLPSIYKYIEKVYKYTIYVGIDKGDYLETIKDKLESKFEKVKVVVAIGRSFTRTVNAIARVAYQDGMDYLVRINDDSSFETPNWTTKGISILQNYSPPNIGVVGPTCHQGNTAILTHDMVHRTHLDIFDFYYPPYFENWWADDWITSVYKPGRSTKLSTWVVKHHVKSHGTRYKVNFKERVRLDKTLTFDRERLSKYISEYSH